MIFDLTETEVSNLKNPSFKNFLEYWISQCKGALAPNWKNFDLMELSPRIIPFITVVDVGYQPLAFTYRFWGTGQTQVKGHDFTGKSPLAHIPKEHGELIFREYEIVTERKEPAAFIRGIHPKDYSPSKIQETLRLPLSDDGETINHVVSFADWRTDMELWKQMYKRMYKRMSDH